MAENAGEQLSPLKRALLEIREMRGQLDEYEAAQSEPIAVIGMGIHFPGGVNSPDDYWEMLKNGLSGIRDIPNDRWDMEAYYDADPTAPGKMYTRKGGFLENVDQFDPYFFGISPREAISMDPQQRLVLETAWEALERAGVAPDKLDGSQTGVFLAISNSDYGRTIWEDTENIDVYFATGTTFSVAAGRLSYILGLQGPNLAIDTACSGSLVAVHLAAQSLRARESDLALAGGVNLILAPEANINFSKAGMMAVDGECKTFDAAANGYVRSEGCGIIALKRLSDAEANGDNILALILGSGVNQDGRSSGLTAPNGPSQEAVIRTALKNSRLTSNLVGYVEAHGTGTSLGDPIEVQAVAAALGEGHTKESPLLIGSVKTNIGHLEAAAGIAGLMKAVLMLQHGEIVPQLHLKKLNPLIPWEEIPVEVTTHSMPFPERDGRKIAGVSSFGFSGTNVHVMLEAAPTTPPPALPASEEGALEERPVHVLTLSARRVDVLGELVKQFAEQLAEMPEAFTNICFTANTGRAHLTHRLAVTAESASDAREKLLAFVAGPESAGVVYKELLDTRPPEIAFLFTGHGAQYERMGRVLYQTQPVFRAAIDECAEILKGYFEPTLYDILFAEEGKPSLMNKMVYAQPALYSLQYALAKTWLSWGVSPTTVMGHSVGEYAAACIAGVFSVADGMKLVHGRGRLFDSLTEPGEMVAVFAPEEQVAAAIAAYTDKVSIGVINGPTNIVISGATETVEVILSGLQAQGVKFRRLDIPQSSHSPLLEPILDEFERIAGEITYYPPKIALLSDVTGEVATFAEVGNAAYWRKHLRQPVRFANCIETLHSDGYQLFLEIGPNPALLGMGRRCLPSDYGVWMPSLRQDWNDWAQMLESLAALYVNGVDVDWTSFDRDYHRQRLALPTYPWIRERYWYDFTPAKQIARKVDMQGLWQSVVENASQQAQQAPLDLNLGTYAAKWAALDRLTLTYEVNTLHQFGVFGKAGEKHTVISLIEQSGIEAGYKSLLFRWLSRLAEAGLLTQDGDTFTSVKPLATLPLDEAWEETRAALVDIPQLMDYLKRCGDHLVDILKGAYSPLETLFPGGSYEFVEFFYNGWSVLRYTNGIARAAVNAAINRLGGRDIHVLEIGAGTGGTSMAVLSAFPPERTTYHYTDVSDFFLGRAEQKFSAYPFVHYGILNIEQAPEEQGYTPHSMDMVIAANALHATRDLGVTLDHARSLLAPNGLLILNETTTHLHWFDMTTGLIEGWGRFEDDVRGDNPLLTPANWREILLAHGFEAVLALPENETAPQILGQHIIIARASGIGERVEVSIQHVDTARMGAETSTPSGSTAAEFRQELATLHPDDRMERLTTFVRGRVARTLRLAASHPLDQRQRLMDMGLDSLMAVELRNALDTGLGAEGTLPATLIFDYPTIEGIVTYLEANLFTEAPAEAVTSTAVDTPQAAVNLDEMTDEEVAALLMKKLGDI